MALNLARLYALVGLAVLMVCSIVGVGDGRWLYQALLGAAVVASLDRVRRERGPARWPWALFAGGVAAWLVGELMRTGAQPPPESAFPSAADGAYLLGYVLLVSSVGLAARLRSDARDAVSMLDGLLVATAVGVPLWALWIAPVFQRSDLDWWALSVSVAYPVLDLALLTVVVRFVLGDGRWHRATMGFAAGAALVVASDIAHHVAGFQRVDVQVRPTDLGWLIALVLWGSAALRPADPRVFSPGLRPGGVGLQARTWVLFLVLALPLAVVGESYLSATTVVAETIVVPLLLMSLLTFLRLRVVSRQSSTAWQGVAILSVTALLVVGAALGIARANLAGRQQQHAAERVALFAAEIRRADTAVGLLFREGASEVRNTQQTVLPLSQRRLGEQVAALGIPAQSRIQVLLNEYVRGVRAELARVAAGDRQGAFQVEMDILAPARSRLMTAVESEVARYRAAATTSAQRGRAVSVAVLVAALAALWILMLLFGSANRRAEAAEERSRAVRESEDRVRALLAVSNDVLTVLDPDTRVLAHGDLVATVLDVEEIEEGFRLDTLLSPRQAAETRVALANIAGNGGARARLVWTIRRPDGTTMEAEVLAVDHTSDPRIGGIVVNVHDISRRRRLEAELEHQALHDPLTGLPNRALIKERVAELFTQSRSGAPSAQALIMVDLDDFRSINDAFGHRQGDQLLTEVARRLSAYTWPDDTLGRVGGDAFVFFVEDVKSVSEALKRADLMIAALSEPIHVAEGVEHLLHGSVGVAIGDGTGDGSAVDQAALLFRDAELAMYEAKRHGGNSIEVFEPHMHDAVAHRLALRAEMVVALQRGEFVLHYQPIIDLQKRAIAGYEALVRWNHPERGMVSPADFIPVAEQSGLIVELGDWVLREATRQLAAWQTGWDEERYIAVNVAGQQLERADHLKRVRDALQAAGLPPRQLLIEMTESSLIRDTESSIARLEALRGLGVRLAIDDFGTGYSSLNYLHRFAVDVLKIDKSFIDDVADGARGHSLVDAIVTMARRLGLKVVAEGIEEVEQAELLGVMECAMGQGFHFSRPLPADAVGGFALPPRDASGFRRVA